MTAPLETSFSLETLMREAWEAFRGSIRTCFPAKVESYDPGTQEADVKPLLKDVIRDPDGNVDVKALAVIPAVRVLHPRGGGYFASFPLAKGDFVLVVCCQANLNRWMEQKGADVDPGDLRRHTLDGAVALPCNMVPDGQELEEADADTLVVGKDKGLQMRITDSLIEMGAKGSGSLDFVALAQKVDQAFSTLQSDLNTIKAVFSAWTPVAQDGGAALKAAAATWAGNTISLSSTAASKLKGE